MLEEEPNLSLTERSQTFRRQHVLQTVIYAVASIVVLGSLLASLLIEGWRVIEAEESGKSVVPITLAPDTPPGLIQVRLFLDGDLIRNGALVIAPSWTKSALPFQRLELGAEPDVEGHFEQASREFTVSQGEFNYVLDGISFRPQSVLSVRWTVDGSLVTPRAHTIEGPEIPPRFIGLVDGVDGDLGPGEYQVLISLDGQPVHADTVVVE